MQIREYTAPTDGTQADPSDYRTVLSFPRRFDFHNGGSIRFGTDGMLYLSSGDSQGTPQETNFDNLGDSEPQTPAHDFFGKILRLDVDGNDNVPGNGDDDGFAGNDDKNYQIPANNPFAGGTAADDEVYAYGLRNPWSMTVDAVTGDLWIGDVGYNTAEEVNVVPAASGGGQNFGWPHFEGTGPTPGTSVTSENPAGPTPHVPPIHSYPTIVMGQRGFVIAGFAYRGPDPELQGKFIYYEAGRRKVFSFDPNAPAVPPEDITSVVLGGGVDPGGLFAAFAQDANGNLYLLSHSEGDILRILTSNPDPSTLDPAAIDTTGPGEPGTRGDFNSDGFVNAKDIDLLALAAKNFSNHPLYDLEGMDGVTFQANATGTDSDSDELIRALVETRDLDGLKTGTGSNYGDANLDGMVFLSDLTKLATNYRQAGQFGWADGNFNGSLEPGTTAQPRVFLADLTALATQWRFGVGTGSAIEIIPEPGTWFMALTWALASFCRYRTRRN
jgi:glucose/arabinose dehydrogenase